MQSREDMMVAVDMKWNWMYFEDKYFYPQTFANGLDMGCDKEKKSRVTKIFGVDNLKNRVAIWRRKQVWKEIWREELKSEFRHGKFEIPVKYPDGTIKQMFGYAN